MEDSRLESPEKTAVRTGNRASSQPTRTTIAPRTIGPGRPTIRTTFQLAADVLPRSDQSRDAAQQECVQIALRWLASKFPAPLGPDAAAGQGFVVEVPGQAIHCVAIPEEGIWSARLSQPDAPFAGRAAVPGRVWTTEIAFARQDASVRFGVQVLCASLPYATEPIALTRPRIVRDLAARVMLVDVRPLDGRPWQLQTEEDLQKFYDAVTNPNRSLPVYLLTQPDGRRLGLNVAPFLLNADDLARQVQGAALVATMPKELGLKWTDRVGKSWSAYLGAIRTYRPGLSFDEDSPGDHPLVLADRVLAYEYQDLKMEAAFTAFLAEQANLSAATRRIHEAPCLFYADAVRRRAERGRAEAVQAEDIQELYEAEIQALKDRIERLEKEAEAFNDDAMAAERERDRQIDENRALRYQLTVLRDQLESKTGQSADQEVLIPDDYDELPAWVDEHLVGRLVLHPRAIRGVKTASYDDPGLVYRSLLLLAREYRNMRLGNSGAREAWDAGLAQLELRYGQSIAEERAGEQGETYYVKYPVSSTKRRFLELHLRKGSTKDDRYCLGIYFFWDEEAQQVVIGWLPSHLETRAS